MLYVYALVEAGSEASGPGELATVGLAGERLRLVACAPGLWAAVGEMEDPPAVGEGALRGHDAAVRALLELLPGVLPARFGAHVGEEGELRSRIAPRSAAIARALALVRGREQMTLRVFAADAPLRREAGAAPRAEAEAAAVGSEAPGTRYLLGRARSSAMPELGPLRDALRAVVVAERLERHPTPPLLASLYHLIERGRAPDYTAAVEAFSSSGHLGLRLHASGPWPAYAFAPEEELG